MHCVKADGNSNRPSTSPVESSVPKTEDVLEKDDSKESSVPETEDVLEKKDPKENEADKLNVF